jgi:hypothetical protein
VKKTPTHNTGAEAATSEELLRPDFENSVRNLRQGLANEGKHLQDVIQQ